MISARDTHNIVRNVSSETERENSMCCFNCYKAFGVNVGCNYLRTDPAAICMLL